MAREVYGRREKRPEAEYLKTTIRLFLVAPRNFHPFIVSDKKGAAS